VLSCDNLDGIEVQLRDIFALVTPNPKPQLDSEHLKRKAEKRLTDLLGLLESSRISGKTLIASGVGKLLFALILVYLAENKPSPQTETSHNKPARIEQTIVERIARVLVGLNLQLMRHFLKLPSELSAQIPLAAKKHGIFDSGFQTRYFDFHRFTQPLVSVASPAPAVHDSFRSQSPTQDRAKHVARNLRGTSLDELIEADLSRHSQSSVSLKDQSMKLLRKSEFSAPETEFPFNLGSDLSPNRSEDLGKRKPINRSNCSSRESEKQRQSQSDFSFGLNPADLQSLQDSLEEESAPAFPPMKQEELAQSDLLPKGADFGMKFEGLDLPRIRKKICRKIYAELTSMIKANKNTCKTLTLNLEFRINSNCEQRGASSTEYVSLAKQLIHHLKAASYDAGLQTQRNPPKTQGHLRFRNRQAAPVRRCDLQFD